MGGMRSWKRSGTPHNPYIECLMRYDKTQWIEAVDSLTNQALDALDKSLEARGQLPLLSGQKFILRHYVSSAILNMAKRTELISRNDDISGLQDCQYDDLPTAKRKQA